MARSVTCRRDESARSLSRHCRYCRGATWPKNEAELCFSCADATVTQRRRAGGEDVSEEKRRVERGARSTRKYPGSAGWFFEREGTRRRRGQKEIPRPAQKRQSGLREAGSRCYLRYGTAYGPMRSRCCIPLTNYSMDPRFSTMRTGCRDVAMRRTAADF